MGARVSAVELTALERNTIAQALRLMAAETDTRAAAYARDSVHLKTADKQDQCRELVRCMHAESNELRRLAVRVDSIEYLRRAD